MQILRAAEAQFYGKSLLRGDQLEQKRLNYPVNRETGKVRNPFQPFEVSRYYLLGEKCRLSTPTGVHVTLKAGVIQS